MAMRDFVRDQPVLAGCLGVLGCGGLVTLGGIAAVLLAGRGCMQAANNTLGLDSILGTSADLAAAGYGLNVSVENGRTEYTVRPLDLDAPAGPRETSCDALYALIGPHLTGSVDAIEVRSWSIVEQQGALVAVPVECRWTGLSEAPRPGDGAG